MYKFNVSSFVTHLPSTVHGEEQIFEELLHIEEGALCTDTASSPSDEWRPPIYRVYSD